MPTELAHRVARHHQADVIFRHVPAAGARIEYTDSGRISAVALRKMLEPKTGFLVQLKFRPSMTGTPNTISWESLDKHANLVTGRLTLHAAIGDTEILSWAEVVVDHGADPIAERVAREYMRRGEGLVAVDDEEDEPVDDDGKGEPRTVLVDPEDLRLIERADQRNT